ncbi:uncharacterized protein LOC107019774 [Solanum pennellii]|uniref:Uncharacterized protein LOC107019774 n=1 Tax=Solanum pennellii TaxID=28526 RepID=A0ABM1GT58_SOLPN|nr:uncharacterized protein LOC107019774 [Solanum pennellii]
MIQPSKALYGASVLFQKKQDGTMRMCVNYRALNKANVKNKYPVLLVQYLMDRLSKACWFTKLDLREGYWQAIGGMIVHEGHHVAFESRKLNDAEQRYSTNEKEMVDVVHCPQVADALSQKEVFVAVYSISKLETDFFERIKLCDANDQEGNMSKRAPPSLPTQFDAEI